MTCNVYWGSHGCSHDSDHEGQHLCYFDCGADAEDEGITLEEHMKKHDQASAEDYGSDGCVATWPYYGRKHMTGEGGLQFWRFDENHKTIEMPEEFTRLEALHREEKK